MYIIFLFHSNGPLLPSQYRISCYSETMYQPIHGFKVRKAGPLSTPECTLGRHALTHLLTVPCCYIGCTLVCPSYCVPFFFTVHLHVVSVLPPALFPSGFYVVICSFPHTMPKPVPSSNLTPDVV